MEIASVACRLSLSGVYHKVDFERAKRRASRSQKSAE
jgi:hypothetical protein